MSTLPCGCGLESAYSIPKKEALDAMSGKQLRSYLNAHNVSPTGKSAHGFASWRNSANPSEMKAALNAHRDRTYIAADATGKGAYPPVDTAKLGELIHEVTHFLQTVSPEVVLTTLTALVDEKIAAIRGTVQQIQINLDDLGNGVVLESQHKDFTKLLRAMASGVNVMMVGPAGSGKTEAAMAACKAIGKEFELISVGPQTMQSELAGFKNALGEYNASCVRRAFEHGKVLIIDEIDSGNAGVFTFTNATLSNAYAGYPDGIAARHPDFQVIACANTFGTGADMVYIGRSQLDGATLDRYCVLVWDYDNDFEMTLALSYNVDARPWVEKVQHWRENMLKHKLRHIISPRASIFGAKLMKQGFTEAELAAMLVFKGLNKEAVDKIRGGA